VDRVIAYGRGTEVVVDVNYWIFGPNNTILTPPSSWRRGAKKGKSSAAFVLQLFRVV